MLMAMTRAAHRSAARRRSSSAAGRSGLLVLMALLYIGGALVNPAFFGSTDALHALLRDTVALRRHGGRHDLRHRQQGSRPFGRLDLRPGRRGLRLGFSPRPFSISASCRRSSLCLLLGAVIGLINGVLVTILRVPAFIATLTMLFIGRGFVLGLTGGQSIYYPVKATDYPLVLPARRDQRPRLQQPDPDLRSSSPWSAPIVLAKTRWGYETFATGGNEQAAIYAGIPTHWVRIRAYLLSSLCATLAGLMAVAQDKGVTPQYGLSAELIVIASVIIGGASILGGRGRVIGACLGAAAHRADRQGAARRLADHPHHHRRRRGHHGQRDVHRCRPARCRPSSASCWSSRC